MKLEIKYIIEDEIDNYLRLGYEIKFMKYYDLNKRAFIAMKKIEVGPLSLEQE